MDGKKNSQRQKRQSKTLEDNVWDCSVCTFRNTAEAFKCAMCDVRKGTSTRKPRLNPQLVAQQVAQQLTTSTPTKTTKSADGSAVGGTQQEPPSTQQPPRSTSITTTTTEPPLKVTKDHHHHHQRSGTKSQNNSTGTGPEDNGTISKPKKKKIRNIRPRLKNIDRSQVHCQPVTVNNVTVVITEFLPKCVAAVAASVAAAAAAAAAGSSQNSTVLPTDLPSSSSNVSNHSEGVSVNGDVPPTPTQSS